MTDPSVELVEVIEEPADTIVVPITGEIVDRNDERRCIEALELVRLYKQKADDVARELTDAIVTRAGVLGKRTLMLDDGRKATVSSDVETTYDAHGLEEALRELGMPEERIREIVVEEVSYKVNAVEAKRAAGANREYAAAVEQHRIVRPKQPYVSSPKR